MRRLIVTSAMVAAGTVGALTGCGEADTPPAVTVQTTDTPRATATTATSPPSMTAVTAAFANLRDTAYMSSTVTAERIDVTGLDHERAARLEAVLERNGSRMTTTTRFASPGRVAIAQDIAGRTRRIVLYDGSVYVHVEGSPWARLIGDAARAFPSAASPARIDPAAMFTGITPDGTTDVLGRPATRYAMDVDVGRADELAVSVMSGLGDAGPALAGMVGIERGTAVIAIDDTRGAVSQMELTMDVSLDLEGIAMAAGQDGRGTGAVGIESRSRETVTRFGGVTVVEPRAGTTISTITGLGEYLAKG